MVGGRRWALDIDGAVQAEVLGLRLGDDGIELTGPCGPAPWYIQVGAADDPLVLASAMVSGNLGEPLAVHSTSWRRARSTSWRRARGAVVLTFAAALGADHHHRRDSAPVRRVALARNSATEPPSEVSAAQVIEHALRHLAWLVADDLVVADRLGYPWARALRGYRPEPFRAFAAKEGTAWS
jgi:hypothetical protein